MNRRKRQRQPTRDDVAKRAEVSTAVVSYVVNDGPRRVAPETRARVEAAIAELGYRPNRLARGLKVRRSETIGLIAPTLMNPVYAEIAAGLKDSVVKHGYSIFLCETEDDVDQARRFGALLDTQQVDGVVVVPTGDPTDVIEPLLANDTPIVMLEHASSEVPSIIVDDHRGGFMAAAHLADLGHTRIGLVRGRATARTSSDRVLGYRDALEDRGLAFDASITREIRNHFALDAAEQAATELLTMDDRPTAIVAHNDWVAIAVISAAHRLGLEVPDDLSVVGYDNIQVASFTNPSLTTVHLPKRDLGQLAGTILLEQMMGSSTPPALTKLMPDLIVRESTGRPKA